MKDKEKQIEEMAKDLHSTHAISSVCSGKNCNHCKYDSLKNFNEYTCIDLSLANDLYNAGYRKIDKNSVVISKEELTKRDYEFRQIGYDECLRDNPKKDKYIKTLERKIDQLNAKLNQANKETAEKILKETEWLFRFCGQLSYLDELKKQFGVDVKE